MICLMVNSPFAHGLYTNSWMFWCTAPSPSPLFHPDWHAFPAWNPMKSHEIPWFPMKSHDFPWFSPQDPSHKRVPKNPSLRGQLIFGCAIHLCSSSQGFVHGLHPGRGEKPTINGHVKCWCFIQLWPWLLVVTGYFYGIINSTNGVTSTYNW